jgi:acyl-CoA synthetase (NDP forming)
MLSPARAVFIGGAIVAPAIEYCRARGYRGSIEVVNPRRTEIAGIPCRSSLVEVEAPPDIAFVAVPKEATVETVAGLSRLGAAAAVCNSSGFSESGQDGERLQAALREAAGDMPLLGPNAPGFANFLDRAAFMMDHFGDHAPETGVAVLSNGGAYLSDIGCADRSLSVGYLVGLGNQAMVSVADLLEVLLDDRRVTAINIYFEALTDVAKLSAAALKAARRDVPVVVVKGGRSVSGSRATLSHTASLSGDAALASALFERFGWIEVATPSEALETLKMLTCTGLPRGPRTAFATSSGSYAVLGADLAERAGLTLPVPGSRAAAALRENLPSFVGPANPLDISTAHGAERKRQRDIYAAFFVDGYDLAVQVMCYPPKGGWDRSGWDDTTVAFSEAARDRDLPHAFINTLPETLPEDVRARMVAGGMAPLQGLEDGFRAVGHAVRHALRARSGAWPAEAEILMPVLEVPAKPLRYDEAEAKALLSAAGVRVPKGCVVRADQSPEDLRYPLAVKALSGDIAHKTELGAVALNLTTPAAVRQATAIMQARLRAKGLSVDRFLVEEMIGGTVAELLVGVRHESGIGLTLTLAVGGVAVELMRDFTTVILPAGRAQIERALRSLKLFPLLDGWRGRPRANTNAALDAIEALCTFAEERRDRLVELEVNPLVLTERSAVAVDAVLSEASQ